MGVVKIPEEFKRLIKEDLGYEKPLPSLDQSTLEELRNEIVSQCQNNEDCKKQKFFELVKKFKELDQLSPQQRDELIMQLLALWLELDLTVAEIQKELEELKRAINSPEEPLQTEEADGENPERASSNPFFDGTVLEKFDNDEISSAEVLMYAVDVVLSNPKYQQAFVKMVQNPELVKACDGKINCILENALLAGFANKDGTANNNYIALEEALKNFDPKEKQEILGKLYESVAIANAVDEIMEAYIKSLTQQEGQTDMENLDWDEIFEKEGTVGVVKRTYEIVQDWLKGGLKWTGLKDANAQKWSQWITLGGTVIGAWLALQKVIWPNVKKGWKKFWDLHWTTKIGIVGGLWLVRDIAHDRGATLDWFKTLLFGEEGANMEIEESSPEKDIFYLDSVLVAILPSDKSLEDLEKDGFVVYNSQTKKYEVNWDMIKDHPLVKTLIKTRYKGNEEAFKKDLNQTINSLIKIIDQNNDLSEKFKLKDIVAQKWRMAGELKMMISPTQWSRLKEIGKSAQVHAIILEFERGEITFEQAKAEIQKLLEELGDDEGGSGDSETSPSNNGGGAILGSTTAASSAGVVAGTAAGAAGRNGNPSQPSNRETNPTPSDKGGEKEQDDEDNTPPAGDGPSSEYSETITTSLDRIKDFVDTQLAECNCSEEEKAQIRADAYSLAYFIFLTSPKNLSEQERKKLIEEKIREYIYQQEIEDVFEISLGADNLTMDLNDPMEIIRQEIESLPDDKAEKLAKDLIQVETATTVINILLAGCEGKDCENLKTEVAKKLLFVAKDTMKFMQEKISQGVNLVETWQAVLNIYMGALSPLYGDVIKRGGYEKKFPSDLKEFLRCDKGTAVECQKEMHKKIIDILIKLDNKDLAINWMSQYFAPPEGIDSKKLSEHKQIVRNLLVRWSYALAGQTKEKIFEKEGIDKNIRPIDEFRKTMNFYNEFYIFGKKVGDILDNRDESNILNESYKNYSKALKDPDILASYGIDSKELKFQRNGYLDFSNIPPETQQKLVDLYDSTLASAVLIKAIQKIAQNDSILKDIDDQYPGAGELIKFVNETIRKEKWAAWRQILIMLGSLALTGIPGMGAAVLAGRAVAGLRWGMWAVKAARWAGGTIGFTAGETGVRNMLERDGNVALNYIGGFLPWKWRTKDLLLNGLLMASAEFTPFLRFSKIPKVGKYIDESLWIQKMLVGGLGLVTYGGTEALLNKEFSVNDVGEAISIGILMGLFHGPVRNTIFWKEGKVYMKATRAAELLGGSQDKWITYFEIGDGLKVVVNHIENKVFIGKNGEVELSISEFLKKDISEIKKGLTNLSGKDVNALKELQFDLGLEGWGATWSPKGLLERFRYGLNPEQRFSIKDNNGKELGKIFEKDGIARRVELPDNSQKRLNEVLSDYFKISNSRTRTRTLSDYEKWVVKFVEVLEGKGKIGVPRRMVSLSKAEKNPKIWNELLSKTGGKMEQIITIDGKPFRVVIEQKGNQPVISVFERVGSGEKIIFKKKPMTSFWEKELLEKNPQEALAITNFLRNELFLKNLEKIAGSDILKRPIQFKMGNKVIGEMKVNSATDIEIVIKGQTLRYNSLEEALKELEKRGILQSHIETLLQQAGLWNKPLSELLEKLKLKMPQIKLPENLTVGQFVGRNWGKILRGLIDRGSVGWIVYEDWWPGEFDGIEDPASGVLGLIYARTGNRRKLNRLEKFVIAYTIGQILGELVAHSKEYSTQ